METPSIRPGSQCLDSRMFEFIYLSFWNSRQGTPVLNWQSVESISCFYLPHSFLICHLQKKGQLTQFGKYQKHAKRIFSISICSTTQIPFSPQGAFYTMLLPWEKWWLWNTSLCAEISQRFKGFELWYLHPVDKILFFYNWKVKWWVAVFPAK